MNEPDEKLIKKYRQILLDKLHIYVPLEETVELDNLLFYFWHLGWLDKIEQSDNAYELGKADGYKEGWKSAILKVLDILEEPDKNEK